jgi:hypothetical protein
LTQGLPDAFGDFLKAVLKLGYDEKPPYEVRCA